LLLFTIDCREGMRMMGLSDSALFVAWYITYGILFLLIAFVIAVIAGSTFFSNSDGGLLFLYFTFFGWSAMALCVLLSTFFSRAKLAAAVGAVIFIATFFPYFSVNDRTKSDAAKAAASILSPVSFGLALDVVSQLEANGVGVGWKNLYQPIAAGSNYSFGTAMGFLILDFFIYTFLALYLGNVLPQEFGVPLPWYYPCTPRWLRESVFCCCCGRKNSRLQGANEDRHRGHNGDGDASKGLLAGIAGSLNGGSGGGVVVVPNPAASLNSGAAAGHSASAGETTPASWAERFERIGLATGDAVEPPGPQLRDMAAEGRNIAVRSLNKLFQTPDGLKAAVDNVDLDMFEGQIFGLLGHNGAGKTTLISMLTGLIPPTNGDAWIYGKSITNEMQDIRGSLGVCPQHDVLWPDLTVKEHLMFFAGIKGMPQKEIYPAVMSMIREVGLTEKVDTKSAELSGGQKRKLSVGIALIGGSRVVVLDEPTSGVSFNIVYTLPCFIPSLFPACFYVFPSPHSLCFLSLF
jgi:ABC-type Na+ transport system ATPase subunit NatA